MPLLSQIVASEDGNTHTIYLYREGIFYKAYERSAYMFVTSCRAFKVKKRYYKCVDREVVSVGFPSQGIEKLFSKDRMREVANGVEIGIDEEVDIDKYEAWRRNVQLTEESSKKQLIEGGGDVATSRRTNQRLSDVEIVMKIRTFPIEAKTPLECMLFLSEVKDILK